MNEMSEPTAIDYNKQVTQLAEHDGRQAIRDELVSAGRAGLNAMKQGFQHANWRVRRECVAFMDHHARQDCVQGLLRALKDSNQTVRRNAIHSLSCDRCKPSPLQVDSIPMILDVARNDVSLRVRRSAVILLTEKKPDSRVVPALLEMQSRETDQRLLKLIVRAIKQHESAVIR